MTTEDQRTAYTGGLRALARFLDDHPEVPLPYHGAHAEGSALPAFPIYLTDGATARAGMAVIARAMGGAVKAPKTHHDGTEDFQVWREFGGIVLYAQAPREQVCTRRVTGTREVTEEIPDPDAPKVTVTRTVEDVTWECGPLLAPPAEPEPSAACSATFHSAANCPDRQQAAARDAEAAQVQA